MRQAILVLAAVTAFMPCAPGSAAKADGKKGGVTRVVGSGVAKERWTMYPLPRTGDQPGTVIRVEGDGTRHLVAQLQVPTRVDSASDVTEITSKHKNFKVGVFLRFLSFGLFDGGGERYADTQVVRTLRGVAILESLEDPAEAVLDAWLPSLKWHLENNSRYYIIDATKSVDSIDWTGSHDLLVQVGGSVELSRNLAAWQAKSPATYKSNAVESFDISQEFKVPHNVEFVARELIPPRRGARSSAPEEVKRVPRRSVTWDIEGDPDVPSNDTD